MSGLVTKDRLISKLAMLLTGGKVSVEDTGEDLLRLKCQSADAANDLAASLSAIALDDYAVRREDCDIKVDVGSAAFSYSAVESCVQIVERVLFLTGFTGWQYFSGDNSQVLYRSSVTKLSLKRVKGELLVVMPAEKNLDAKVVSAYLYPSIEMAGNGFEMKISEDSLEKLDAMVLALVNPNQLSGAEDSHSQQVSSIYHNMRAVRALRHLLGLEPALKYFSRFSVFKSVSRISFMPKTVYIIESVDPAAMQLAHDFLKRKVLIDCGESAFEKDGKYWLEIDEDEILDSLGALEMLPAFYQKFAAVVAELYRIPGISRMSLRNGQIRIRCDLATFSELSRLAWAKIPLGRTSGKAGRTYSNRIYFDPIDLTRQLAELHEIADISSEKSALGKESIAA